MRYILTIALAFAMAFSASAQKPAKGFEDLVAGVKAKNQTDIDANMNKAKVTFDKILLKDSTNAMANMGMAVIYAFDKYTDHDYFRSWNHFKKAEAGVETFTPDDLQVLDSYFTAQKLERRGGKIAKNMEIERKLIEERLVKFVREENKIEYANRFISEFPDSKYYGNAVHIRNYIEFRTAENSESVDAFNSFIEKYPDAAQIEIAKEERDALAYKQALAANTYEALLCFVEQYPNAIQHEEAKKKVGIMAYEKAAAARSIEAIDDFIEKYPNSSKQPEAKQLKRQLLFEWAKRVNSLEAYNKFVSQYPEGEFFVDVFNLKTKALGDKIKSELPADNYQLVLGFDNNNVPDFGGSLALLSDGGIMLAINSKQDEAEMNDCWFVRLAANGTMVRNDIMGNDFDDQINTLLTDASNNIYGVGYTNAINGSVVGQSWLVKFDAKGKNLFNTKLDGTEMLDMALYNDGKMLLVGYQQDSVLTPMIVKVNAQGRKLWTRTYAQGNKISSVALNGDVCNLAVGNWIFALDELGYLKYDYIFDTTYNITTVTANSGLAVYAGTNGTDGVIVAFDSKGSKVWESAVSLPTNGQFSQACAMSDGSTVFAGTFGKSMQIVRVDAKGNLISNKTYSASKSLSVNDVKASGSSLFVSATYDAKDVVLIKF